MVALPLITVMRAMRIIHGLPLPDGLPRGPINLADLIFRPTLPTGETDTLLLGTVGQRPLDLSLARFRCAVLDLVDRFEGAGLRRGHTVCLARLPRTSETAVSVAYAALTCSGIRVMMPMYLEKDALGDWLRASGASAVLWSGRETVDFGTKGDVAALIELERQCRDMGVPTFCLWDDLGLLGLLEATGDTASPSTDDARVLRLRGNTAAESECLILTTSGTSGRAKLMRYRQSAFLRSIASWEAAGLYRREALGGRALCLLLAHSMGVRAFWNAVATGQALCLIPPEWFLEHPERVASLLEHMRPEHVTGGPAVFRTLLEFVRFFPHLKTSLTRHLRCAVSSGAPFDDEMGQRWEAALGVRLENAFGTTETQQILSTLVAGPFTRGLGNPLPGVELRLRPLRADGSSGPYRLQVRSPFGCLGTLGERDVEPAAGPAWFDTGDLVEFSGDGLRYVGREEEDFVKDGFGVKVPRMLLQRRYAGLGHPVEHLELFPIRDEPGLAALVFVNPTDPNTGTVPAAEPSAKITDRVGALLEARHERLRAELDDMDLRHLTITRFACVAIPPPRTIKGNVAVAELRQLHAGTVLDLTGPWVRRPGLVQLDRERRNQPDTVRLVRPLLGEVLRALRLDKQFERGLGDRLYYRERGEEHEVVDLVGGFGGNLLGHRHPEVMDAARRFIDGDRVFLCDQGSAREHEGKLARQLALAVSRETGGSYVVRFGSTGAEAVEMAIAHAYMEQCERVRRFVRDQKRHFGRSHPRRVAEIARRAEDWLRSERPVVLTLAGGFHGHTLGARSLLGYASRHSLFRPLMGIEQLRLPVDGVVDLAAVVAGKEVRLPALASDGDAVVESDICLSRIVAAIAEPILGEGGITLVDPGLLHGLGGFAFPLILDEIQCGLGRTGRFLASAEAAGHYYLFAKALGGGVAKVSALLIDRGRYLPRFDRHYSSTFAGDGFSCAIACRALEVIERDDVPARAARRGEALRQRLEQVRLANPSVIRSVRGRGLMQGLELDPAAVEGSFLLRMVAQREHLGLLASAYLLNRYGVRVLPTLSAPNTLRLEPSAYVDDAAITRLVRGLTSFCDAVRRLDTYELVSFLVEEELEIDRSVPRARTMPVFSSRIEAPAPGAVRVAFLSHFTSPEWEIAFAEPGLRRLPASARGALFQRTAALMDIEHTVAFARNLFGGRIWFASLVLPVDAATLERMHCSGERGKVVERIQDALERATAMGCTVAGLGAYTSIVTDNGTAVMAPPGLRLTTGNALTAAIGVRRVLRICERQRIDPDGPATHLAIVGATGNIGSMLAREFLSGAHPFRRLTLLGRNSERLQHLRDTLLEAWERENPARPRKSPEIAVATDPRCLRGCNVIVSAASTSELLIYPHHLASDRAVLIADLSVPGVISADARTLPNVRIVPLAGTVTLPDAPDFAMSPAIAVGAAYSCAAEAMLLALEPDATAGLQLTGAVEVRSVRLLDRLAEENGMLSRLSGLSRTRTSA
jgi:acetylornithine/succinyldiaminopimelate/putrescine aminotransferase/predicted amino acid dehydrogenase/acyl-coenzyme A synthetase/AMP-(fatty) acid ligase